MSSYEHSKQQLAEIADQLDREQDKREKEQREREQREKAGMAQAAKTKTEEEKVKVVGIPIKKTQGFFIEGTPPQESQMTGKVSPKAKEGGFLPSTSPSTPPLFTPGFTVTQTTSPNQTSPNSKSPKQSNNANNQNSSGSPTQQKQGEKGDKNEKQQAKQKNQGEKGKQAKEPKEQKEKEPKEPKEQKEKEKEKEKNNLEADLSGSSDSVVALNSNSTNSANLSVNSSTDDATGQGKQQISLGNLSKAERKALMDKQKELKYQRLVAEGRIKPGETKSGNKEGGSGVKEGSKEGAKEGPVISGSSGVKDGLKEGVKDVPGKKPSPKQAVPPPATIQYDDAKARSKLEKAQVVPRVESQKHVLLFSHLRQYEHEVSFNTDLKYPIHPAVIQYGLRTQAGHENSISGANARCLGMLEAFKQVIADYQSPPDQILSRHLDNHLKPHISYILNFRPMAVSMGNAIRYLKNNIAALDPVTPEHEAKDILIESIDRFIRERIIIADEVIVAFGVSKINDDDVILTYGCSSIIEKILKEAHSKGKKFRVIIADSRPKLEGRTLLKRLAPLGLKCTYVLLNAVAFVMKEVSKVFLGARALFSNGTVLSRVGTAMIAMMASNSNVPVIVCCETYKFSERVQLDSFVFNELGNPDDLVSIAQGETGRNTLTDWRDVAALKLLNLAYDLTPKEYVRLVITEVGMIPCTSVPVVLREYLP